MGSAGNVALLTFKFIAGVMGHSSAMIADAVNSLSDFITDVVVLAFVHVSAKPQDEGHDYGHGKYETFTTCDLTYNTQLFFKTVLQSAELDWALRCFTVSGRL